MAVIQIWLDDNEKILISKASAKLGLSLSSYCRMVALEKMRSVLVFKSKEVSSS